MTRPQLAWHLVQYRIGERVMESAEAWCQLPNNNLRKVLKSNRPDFVKSVNELVQKVTADVSSKATVIQTIRPGYTNLMKDLVARSLT